MSMLVNAKTKLSNQNHLQNSLKSVNRDNPAALHRMMHPSENQASLMQRAKAEDDSRKPNHFVNFNNKLR
jgi:hypothetical protein